MSVKKLEEFEGRPEVLNGIDLNKLFTSVDALKNNPELAKFKFRLHNRWMGGGHNRSRVSGFFGLSQENRHKQPFELDGDEPEMLAGTDQGANPVEHLLNALAACLTTTMVYHAALRNIKIDELESELEGDIDLRGFLGLSNDVRRGYQDIRVTFRVKTDEKNLDRLKALSKLSPVFDVTTNGTDIDVRVERK
ncbi:MAG: OsmC family protein [Deltaproteobacteria bacterium]|nr:OsmC family protein [Deltaproteobacteria bacterium]MBZ0220183.1 OsmC family protein [Deltaproteobacteria bacterium]